MPATNVKSKWSGGNLYFYDKDGNEIIHFDGTNRAIVLPSGATLTLTGTVAGGVSTVSAVTAVTADGAITISAASKTYYITKAGVAAMTIADPTATTHDGTRLTFMATTANAHTLSNVGGSGFFSSGGGSKDLATFGGAIGDTITIEAYQGKWYIISSLNITLG